ncbi:MAG: CBS domain-containing protein [Deltaproteobacteria bacterium]|nr:CBS domain-containing protein [Deltaproteobacteria bacterium]
MREIDLYKVPHFFSIREAIRQMDKGGIGFVACIDENDNVIGVVSDGDFRRAVLSGVCLENSVQEIINRNFASVPINFAEKDIENIFQNDVVQQIPVIDDGKLVDIITEESFYCKKGKVENKRNKIDLPVVIMAGGKGSRLDPFTRILPKPLIPIGEKPIIEVIMDEYAIYGMRKFYISINHRGRMIKAFFADYDIDYEIKYIYENKPLGTAGALKYLENKVYSPFFVSNCDVIIKADYSAIYKYHVKKEYSMTLIGSMQHHTIPYGVCEIENGGLLKKIVERPNNNFLINTGMYLLNPEVITLIPENESYDMIDLINKLQRINMPVGLFPISADSWLDIGQWEEYKKSVKKIGGEGDNEIL